MQMYQVTRVVKFIMLLGVLVSCKSSKHDSASKDVGDQYPKIIFVDLKIAKDSAGREHVELVSKTRASGNLKARENHERVDQPLICEFLDVKGNLLATITIQNPLNASLED